MENKNGKGIFLGVVSVATLVVAIIGATFAFFSANAAGNDGSINFTSTEMGDDVLTLTDSANFKTNLVPVASEDEKFESYVGLNSTKCVDDEGNGICGVYQFTVTNNGTAAQPIYVTLEPSTNDFGNLYYAVYKTADASVTDHTVATNFAKDATEGGHGTLTAQTTTGNANLIRTATRLDGTTAVDLTELTTTLAATNGTVTYTMVFWVQETQYDQNETDGGAAFAGKISVTTGTGSGLTGVIVAGGAD